MEFQVFHNPTLIGMIDDTAKAKQIWAENRSKFTRVAVVQANNLNDVFRLTNHIDCSWWDNYGVEKVVESARSTSVGDVICRISDESIDWFMVASFGFLEI